MEDIEPFFTQKLLFEHAMSTLGVPIWERGGGLEAKKRTILISHWLIEPCEQRGGGFHQWLASELQPTCERFAHSEHGEWLPWELATQHSNAQEMEKVVYTHMREQPPSWGLFLYTNAIISVHSSHVVGEDFYFVVMWFKLLFWERESYGFIERINASYGSIPWPLNMSLYFVCPPWNNKNIHLLFKHSG